MPLNSSLDPASLPPHIPVVKSFKYLVAFMHMYWNCPGVVRFWKMIVTNLSDLLNTRVPYCPKLLLLNDTSYLNLSPHQVLTLLVGLTAAKKMLALRWQPPHSLSRNQWLQTLLDIAYMEISVAKIHNAKQSTIYAWASFIDGVKD